MDFGDVKKIFEPVFHQMDHHYLNDLKNLGDFTLFGLVKWMKSQLKEFLPALDRINLYESEGNGVELFINKD
jgi:6-pyruvoyltetrahydropterin/6-carboxytetrahydropterin synthase